MNEKDKMDIALERMRYCPESGGLFRTCDCDSWKSGDRVYERSSGGYRVIKMDIRGKPFEIRVHRIGFYFMTGQLPKVIDHVNGIRFDNRWVNIRSVTDQQNCANRRPWGKLGVKGVIKTKSGKFRANIRIDKQNITLGLFDRLSDAADAYDSAAYSVHGEYAWLNCDQS